MVYQVAASWNKEEVTNLPKTVTKYLYCFSQQPWDVSHIFQGCIMQTHTEGKVNGLGAAAIAEFLEQSEAIKKADPYSYMMFNIFGDILDAEYRHVTVIANPSKQAITMAALSLPVSNGEPTAGIYKLFTARAAVDLCRLYEAYKEILHSKNAHEKTIRHFANATDEIYKSTGSAAVANMLFKAVNKSSSAIYETVNIGLNLIEARFDKLFKLSK